MGCLAGPVNYEGRSQSVELVGFSSSLDEVPTSPGPTLRVRAGDTLRINLINTMTPELVPTENVHNNLRQFDTVNLHTHGLHISPNAPGDDIIGTAVGPGESYQYTFLIPEDHMGGTFWSSSTRPRGPLSQNPSPPPPPITLTPSPSPRPRPLHPSGTIPTTMGRLRRR